MNLKQSLTTDSAILVGKIVLLERGAPPLEGCATGAERAASEWRSLLKGVGPHIAKIWRSTEQNNAETALYLVAVLEYTFL